ncbi:GTPase Era, mitochondrial [Halyomorpha halys]|uniref:GTPase Era, mitochondrial n=1 Tax=Halyomorpha halys TaxID=286706 RepID=UPI0006D4EE68|nr:GTPase Era, mitochondrial [Halyomorpha halys]
MWGLIKTLERCIYLTSINRKYLSDIRNYSSEGTNILKVAIVGAPNAGKSTIINQLVKRRVFAISKKVHTTKVCARAILNHGNKQIVFLDTPGLVSLNESERYKLGRSFIGGGEEAILEADLIGVIHDISNSGSRFSLDPKVLRLLNIYQDKESLLVLNKIDTLKSKIQLLDLSKKLTGGKLRSSVSEDISKEPLSEMKVQQIIKTKPCWENFSDVFMVSALLGKGVNTFKNYLLNKAYPGEWIFPADVYTDQDPVTIIEEAVHSKLLEHLPEEIPYNVHVQLEYLDMEKEELISAVVLVQCNSNRLVGLIKGTKGGRIKVIADEAEQAVADAFLTDVHLKLVITEKKPLNVEKSFRNS